MRYAASITIDFVIQAPDKTLAQDILDVIQENCETKLLDEYDEVDEIFDSSTSLLDSENE